MIVLGWVLLLLTPVDADAYFSKTFCSTGVAPKFKLCSRGQDCSQAKDKGLQFKKDGSVSWWLGDAMMSRSYRVDQGVITVIPQKWETEDQEKRYRLSKNSLLIREFETPTHVYSVKSCRK
jgi:hypothetical protein